jgi:hypothetical protein
MYNCEHIALHETLLTLRLQIASVLCVMQNSMCMWECLVVVHNQQSCACGYATQLLLLPYSITNMQVYILYDACTDVAQGVSPHLVGRRYCESQKALTQPLKQPLQGAVGACARRFTAEATVLLLVASSEDAVSMLPLLQAFASTAAAYEVYAVAKQGLWQVRVTVIM